MRKFLTLFVIGIVAVMAWSCSDDDDKDRPLSYDSLPAVTKSFIETYFPGDKPVSVSREGKNELAEYDVKLTSGFELEFDAAGQWVEVDGPMAATIPNQDFIPQPIRDYVAEHYPAPLAINSISRDARGYEVELTDLLEIEFDLNGNFIRVDN